MEGINDAAADYNDPGALLRIGDIQIEEESQRTAGKLRAGEKCLQ
jgi:hypothetical protein